MIGVLVLVALTACAPPSDRLPDKVFVYLTCTVNDAYLTPELAPNLTALANRSVTFNNHRTESGASGIAQASIFTSRHATDHGIFFQPDTIDESIYDFSEALADAGYEVYYFDGHPMAFSDYGYAQASNDAVDGHISTAEFESLMQKPGKIAVFASHTMTHTPYKSEGVDEYQFGHPDFYALSEERVASLVDLFYSRQTELRYGGGTAALSPEDLRDLVVVVETLYRLNITRLDRFFAELMNCVPEDALVVFTADHGESLYNADEDKHWCHGPFLTDDVIKVPFILSYPGAEPAAINGVTRSIDLAPTVMGLLQRPIPDEWQGVDLSDVVLGKAPLPRLLAFAHEAFRRKTPEFVPDFAVYTDEPSVLFLDGEVVEKGQPSEELKEQLKRYATEMTSAFHANVATIPEEASDEILESMGYLH